MNITLSDRLNFYVEFKEWYEQILKDFQFEYQKDLEARDFLSSIFLKKDIDWNLEKILFTFKNKIQAKKFITIYGCGPSLEKTIGAILNIKGTNFFQSGINLAADGASVLLLEKKIPITAIFTDLDGITKQEFNSSDFIIVHAHGDNIDKLRYFQEEIIQRKNIIGTTQVKPSDMILNPGGFTDGDRILYFLRPFLLPEHKIYFVGMDFKGNIGSYSKPKMESECLATPIKKRKLNYALLLIEWLKEKVENELFFVNTAPISNKFKYISIQEYFEQIKD